MEEIERKDTERRETRMSDRHWIRGLTRAACAAAIAGAIAVPSAIPAMAEGAGRTGADDRRYSITVDYSAESHTVPLTGSEFGIVRVMTEGNGEYEPVRGITVTQKQMYGDPAGAALQAEKDVVGSSGLAGKAQKVVPGSNGKATAGNLESGIYLIWQTKREGRSAGFLPASPVLVQLNEKAEVSVQPKTTVIPPVPKKPTTGDSTKVEAWAFAFMAAFTLAAGLAIRLAIDRRQSKGEENRCQEEK